MADAPIEVDVNTDDLDAFSALLNGKAAEAKPAVVADNDEEVIADDDPGATDDDAANDPEDPDNESGDDDTGEEDDGNEDEPSLKSEDDEDDDDDIFKKPKKKQTAKERIAEVTAARREAERERDAERQRTAELEARLRRLEDGRREPEDKPQPRTKAPTDADAPNPDAVDDKGEPVYELGQFDPQYIADLSNYFADKRTAEWQAQRDAEAQQAAREKEDARLQTEWQTKLSQAEETLPDLRETVQTLDGEFRNLEPQYGTYLAQTLMSMKHGPQVLYYLANHVDEARTIVAAGPQGATLALGALEAKVAAALEKKAKNPVRTTAAPKPPVTTRGTGGRSATRGDTDNLDAFEKVFFRRK